MGGNALYFGSATGSLTGSATGVVTRIGICFCFLITPLYASSQNPQNSENPKRSQPVTERVYVVTTRAGFQEKVTLKAPGTLVPERHRVERARSPGRLKGYYFRSGDYVEREQPLFEIENESEGFIYAPFQQKALEPGVISKKIADIGSTIAIGEPVMELYDPQSMRVQLRLPQSAARRVHLGQELLITSSLGQFPAKLTEIERKIDPQTLSFYCWATPVHQKVESLDSLLDSKEVFSLPVGIAVSAVFSEDRVEKRKESDLIVAEEAIVFNDGKTYLFLVDKRGSNGPVAIREEVLLKSVQRAQVLVSLLSSNYSGQESEAPLIVLRGGNAIGHLERCEVEYEEVMGD